MLECSHIKSKKAWISTGIQAGSTFEEIATNELDDIFDASPVVIADELYLRGHKSIYCIAETDE